MIDIKHLNKSDLSIIPKRDVNSNKGTYGHLLIIAGSEGMAGAAYLSALAAYRMGAGLVRIYTVHANLVPLQTLLPEAIIDTYEPDDFDVYINSNNAQSLDDFVATSRADIRSKMDGLLSWIGIVSKLEELISWATTIVIGPGLSRADYARVLVEKTMEISRVPTIIDADALNIIAAHPSLKGLYKPNMIITPHIGEMERLTELSKDAILSDMIGIATSYASNYNITCHLKSYRSITASGDAVYEIDVEAPALSKAGSGDVLTGIIAGLLCLKLSPLKATALGAYIHALSGVEAAKKYGEHGVLARDIAQATTKVLKQTHGEWS